MADNAQECGPCTACCTTMAVVEFGKPYGVACDHVCGSGCGIYSRRPGSCRGYRCVWQAGLLPEFVGEQYRPDRLGVHVDLSYDGPVAQESAAIYLYLYELQEGAWQRSDVGEYVERLRERLWSEYGRVPIVIVPAGVRRATTFPPARAFPLANGLKCRPLSEDVYVIVAEERERQP